MDLHRRSLGSTDIQISPIGIGVMQFAGGHGVFRALYGDIDQRTRSGIIRTALDSGINWFDTAEAYGFGLS